MPKSPESQPPEPQEPLLLGFILEEMMQGDTERTMAEVPRPEWNLEDNPDLLDISAHDQELDNRLTALQRARQSAHDLIDDETAHKLVADMDNVVRVYVENQGYVWDPYYPETEPNSEPGQP